MVKIDDLITKIEELNNERDVLTSPEQYLIIDALILYKEMN